MRTNYKFEPRHQEELSKALQKYQSHPRFLHIQAIYLRSKGHLIKNIIEITQLSYNTIKRATKRYFEGGISELLNDNRGGRKNENMTLEDEQVFIDDMAKLAVSGQFVTVKEMYTEYQKRVGRKTSLSAFYAMLDRNGWHKAVPRSRHPKAASAEEQAAAKKLTKKSKS